MNISYWEQTSFLEDFDVLIIGSGIVGLNAAIELKTQQPSLNIGILERGLLPSGASTKNAGFACFGSMTELLDDLKERPADEVWQLVEQRWKGLLKLRAKLGDDAIGYKHYGGYELFFEPDQAPYETCMNHIEEFNTILAAVIGQQTVFQTSSTYFGLSSVKKLIWNRAEGQIHTGKMMKRLLQLAQSKGINIFNGALVKRLIWKEDTPSIHLDNNMRFNARKIIIATNGFAQQLLPNLAVDAVRNQVLITKPIPNLALKGCFHYDSGYYYFRNIDNRILLGGARNKDKLGETTTELGTSPIIQNTLTHFLQMLYPTQTIDLDYWWSGILGVGQQKKPIIKAITPDVYVAVRLGGMGVAIGTLVGEQVAKLVIENLN